MVVIITILVNNLNRYLLIQSSKRFKSQKIYAKPGWPGCVMNQQKVQEITERATSVEPSNQVVCIVYSSMRKSESLLQRSYCWTLDPDLSDFSA